MSGGPRAALAEAFVSGLRAVDLAMRVREAAPRLAGGAPRVRVIAIGKAAPAMARGALDVLRTSVARALVVVPDGVDASAVEARAEVLRAGHPVPDARSAAAGARALDVARAPAMRSNDVLLVLVSGGASALACAPRGLTLDAKAAIVRAMLASGAPITALNVVRRHLSRIKGGGLARAAAPARVVTLLASDVIDGGPHDIGSGPSVCDPTSTDDARAAFARWVNGASMPRFFDDVAPWSPVARRLRVRVVASPPDLAAGVAEHLARAGYSPRLLPPAGFDVAHFAAEYAALARALGPGEAVVRAAEPTLAIDARAPGRGGRSGHLAALLAPLLPRDVAFLAGASDGVDGTSGAAGACVDADFARALGAARISARLAAFDTAALHEAAATALVLGPTGHNLADVHALARAR